MVTDADKLLKRHQQLIHSEGLKVISHVQRNEDDWVRHTLMLQGYEVPFVFKRKKQYRSLQGATVNLTYYPIEETIAGMAFEQMKVVRVKRA
ncbi:hypothetical protein [Alteromonas lipotrueiana]|uniref:hypothetical protein n=1 Tax=Alteromonas lipotrueiana TaxID=2803815 RepID=UPI001C4635F4|nr:hypothetical protein [Alteromonas lipotrueiana]|tara:strand:- start:50 stop:325 length:276 start_codon:yes stop_codon:yes gene_type:complete